MCVIIQLALALEYLYLCADELQLRLSISAHCLLHLPTPSPSTYLLFPPWETWKHWSTSLKPSPLHQWGFRFSRSGVVVTIVQHLPPVYLADKLHFVTASPSPAPNLVLPFRPTSSSSPYHYPHIPSPPSSSASNSRNKVHNHQRNQSPSRSQQQRQTPLPPAFELGSLDRAACLSDWRGLHDLLHREVDARRENAANLVAIAELFQQVHYLSLGPDDPMWDVVADVRAVTAREAAAFNTALRNLRAVEAVLGAGCWGGRPLSPVSSSSAGGGSGHSADGNNNNNNNNNNTINRANPVDQGKKGGGENGGDGERERRSRAAVEEDGKVGTAAAEQHREESGSPKQGAENNDDDDDDDEIYVWNSRQDWVGACERELQVHETFGGPTPVTRIVVPAGDGGSVRTVLAVRWRLTG